MTGEYKYTCPEQYDKIISAELPNKNKYLELYKMVIKHMMHGPCGALNRNCPCTKNRQTRCQRLMNNMTQQRTYDEILQTINTQTGGIFFVDGPGGTGKTFLYRALLATVREQGKLLWQQPLPVLPLQ